MTVDDLRPAHMASNQRIVESLWCSEHAEEVFRITEKEAQNAWLLDPYELQPVDMVNLSFSLCIAVEEFRDDEVIEENPEGMRLRLVDGLGGSLGNFATGAMVSVRNDGIYFFRFMVLLFMALSLLCN